jgi:hypothetical protein
MRLGVAIETETPSFALKIRLVCMRLGNFYHMPCNSFCVMRNTSSEKSPSFESIFQLSSRILAVKSLAMHCHVIHTISSFDLHLYSAVPYRIFRYMIRHLDHYLDYQREYRGGCCAPARRFLARNLYLVCGNRFGNYLLTLYLSIKVRKINEQPIKLYDIPVILMSRFTSAAL